MYISDSSGEKRDRWAVEVIGHDIELPGRRIEAVDLVVANRALALMPS